MQGNHVSRPAVPFLLLFLLFAADGMAGDGTILFREDFNDLSQWEPLTFPKISAHSTYSIEDQGTEQVLKALSDASASGLIFRRPFNVYDFPRLRWRWKVEKIYRKGDARTRDGDDYPIRIYVIFKYDPGQADFLERLKYRSYKAVYGDYPPAAGLNYIWANREHESRIITSAYTDRAKLIVLEEGETHVGQWRTEEVHILDDYREAFGAEPPETASLAIMNDSDNTGERSVSYVDYLEIFR